MNEASAPAPLRVLLVDRDADELASLASALRARGFAVVLANGARMACERAASGVDVLVVPSDIDDTEEASSVVDAVASMVGVPPPFVVLVRNPEAAWGENAVLRGDVDGLVARLLVLTSRERSAVPDGANTQEETLPQTSLFDVARSLHETRRTGSLAVTTASGAGELRFSRGELVDAVYVRLEGIKALLRLLGEVDATHVFTTGTPIVMRRLTTPTVELLRDAVRQLDEARRLRAVLGAGEPCAFVAVGSGDTEDVPESAAALLGRLGVARSLDDILDDAPEPDVDVLRMLMEFESIGRIRRLPAQGRRLPFVASEQLERVRALAARGRAAGFEGPARIVFAGTAARLGALALAALRLEEAVAPAQPHPSIPAPHEIVTLRLSEGVAIELHAVPLVPAYSPLWPMSLAGAAVVVRLDDAAGDLLEVACAAAAVQAIDGHGLLGRIDETSAEDVAAIVRAALDAA
jgi:hypothetical protein